MKCSAGGSIRVIYMKTGMESGRTKAVSDRMLEGKPKGISLGPATAELAVALVSKMYFLFWAAGD